MFGKTNHIHFVGIGGIGMSGMAELLYNLGFTITGSDKSSSELTDRLISLGIEVGEGHNPDNLPACDVLVYSSAVKQDNPEIEQARIKGIPVIRRAEMLGELLKVKDISIGIAGTHGKTSSASMLGSILTEASLKPTLVIGGIVHELKSNSISGSGDIIVVEADEFDRTFLSLQPTMCAITNLDLEHLDCYENIEDLQNAFVSFCNTVPFYGRVAICIDNENLLAILPNIKRPVITYGMSKQADVKAQDVAYNEHSVSYLLTISGEDQGRVELNVPGIHNVMNSLAAVSLALEVDVSVDSIKKGLATYSGVQRRFEIKYKTNDNVLLVDDYAHHPTEVGATLLAAKEGWARRIVAVFQPHLYSRTRDFYQDFARVFLNCDVLVVTGIYPAREQPIPGISGEIIANKTRDYGHKYVVYCDDKTQIPATIKNIVKPNDLILIMGAGDIWRQIDGIYQTLNHE